MAGVLRWHGGKGLLADRLVPLLPPHDTYCELYGGAAAVLLAKEPARFEVYNDLNGRLVEFFRVLRDRTEDLADAIAFTPYSREEYVRAFEPTDDPVERARRFAVISWMTVQGFSGHDDRPTHWRRLTHMRPTGRRAPAVQWSTLDDRLRAAARRLRRVQIDKRPALELMRVYDQRDVTFYLDPPYPMSTRTGPKRYSSEMGNQDHRALLRAARRAKGSVVISSYPNRIYAQELKGVPHTDFRVSLISANGGRGKGWSASKRLERVWVIDRSRR